MTQFFAHVPNLYIFQGWYQERNEKWPLTLFAYVDRKQQIVSSFLEQQIFLTICISSL